VLLCESSCKKVTQRNTEGSQRDTENILTVNLLTIWQKQF
jgi:hypothetical protein